MEPSASPTSIPPATTSVGGLETSDQIRLAAVFFPEAVKQRIDLMQTGGRFVHYTRAENAVKIIRNKKMWMRKPQWTNDYSEVEHGFRSLRSMFHEGEGGKRFRGALEVVVPNWVDKVIKPFDQWIENYRRDSYVACVSRHESRDDVSGRLHMWRAYCPQGDGVALVIKSAPFTAISDVLGAYSFPVSYRDEKQVDDYFAEIAANVERESDFIRNYPEPARVEWLLHELFRFEMLCTKHGSFFDEQEWRILYSPGRDQRDTKYMSKSVEIISGSPQPVFSIPLEPLPDYDISIPTILDRVIVGPTKFPTAVVESMVHELDVAGMKDASQKVFYSQIPLRL
jgi:hypothetical protein